MGIWKPNVSMYEPHYLAGDEQTAWREGYAEGYLEGFIEAWLAAGKSELDLPAQAR